MKTLSIKWKAAIAATAATVGLIALVGAIQLHFMRQDLTRVLSDAQFALINRVADEIDSKLALHLDVLSRVAQAMSPGLLPSPTAIRDYYRAHEAVTFMFDDVLVFAPDGKLIADLPEEPGRASVMINDRPYFQEVLATRKPLIAGPLIGRYRNEPVAVMATPMLSSSGEVTAVAIGILKLSRNSLFAGLVDATVGKTGYFFMMTKGPEPVYVMHHDRSKIMQKRPTHASNAGDLAQQGQEGTFEGANVYGENSLLTFKMLKKANWILGGVLPTKEAFAPLVEAEQRHVLVSIGVLLLVAPLVWLAVWRLLSPLSTLRDSIQNLRTGDRVFTPVAVASNDEIGELADKFNLLMEERDETDSKLREGEYRLRMITDNMPALISYLDRHQRFRFTNKVYGDWFGYEQGALIGSRLQDFTGAETYAEIKPHVERAYRGEVVHYERAMETPGGRRIVECAMVPDRDASGEVAGVYTLIQDITERKEVEGRLRELVRIDTLTRLPNRYSYNEKLEEAISRSERNNATLALMFLDVDRFKLINDTFGHEAGDEVLKEFARRVAASVRRTDTAARLAGDEFVVILEGLHAPEEAEIVARKILSSLAHTFEIGSHRLTVSSSIGIAVRRRGQMDGDELLKQADRALYVAKRGGRNRYHVDVPDKHLTQAGIGEGFAAA